MPHLRIEAGGSEDYRGMLVLISLPLTISLSTCHVLQSTHSVPTNQGGFSTRPCGHELLYRKLRRLCHISSSAQGLQWKVGTLSAGQLDDCHRPSWCTGRMGSCWLASVTSRCGSSRASNFSDLAVMLNNVADMLNDVADLGG